MAGSMFPTITRVAQHVASTFTHTFHFCAIATQSSCCSVPSHLIVESKFPTSQTIMQVHHRTGTFMVNLLRRVVGLRAVADGRAAADHAVDEPALLTQHIASTCRGGRQQVDAESITARAHRTTKLPLATRLPRARQQHTRAFKLVKLHDP